VRVAAPASFAGAVRRAGLEQLPFADVPPELMGAVFAQLEGLGPEVANQTVIRDVFGRLDAQHALPGIQAAVAAWRPDIILREPAEFASLAVAEATDIPHVEVAIGVGQMMTLAQEHLIAPLAELEALAGLPEGRLMRAMTTAPVFTMVPASLDNIDNGSDIPQAAGRPVMRYRVAAATSGGRLPKPWGDPGHPLVYVTFGTVAAGLGQMSEVFPAALDALADLPVRVLLTTGDAGGLELPRPWPTNTHVEKFWPQDEVMPFAAAMVGHGGFGTTMSALAAGVPQVLVPLFALDQELNAGRVDASGAGLRLAGGPAAVRGLGAAVTQVLDDPDMRRRAREVAAEIASLPSLAAVVEEAERIARGGDAR